MQTCCRSFSITASRARQPALAELAWGDHGEITAGGGGEAVAVVEAEVVQGGRRVAAYLLERRRCMLLQSGDPLAKHACPRWALRSAWAAGYS